MTIFYGEPRFTNDIDIVVDLPEGALAEFCRQFPEEEFYVREDAASEAVRRHSRFNIIRPRSGVKVDVFVPLPSEFNRARLARTRRVQAGDGRPAFGRVVRRDGAPRAGDQASLIGAATARHPQMWQGPHARTRALEARHERGARRAGRDRRDRPQRPRRQPRGHPRRRVPRLRAPLPVHRGAGDTSGSPVAVSSGPRCLWPRCRER